MFAILLLGAAYALCGNVGKRETEAHAEADAELKGYLSRGFEGFGEHGRSRRSPIKPGVGFNRACAVNRRCEFFRKGCDYECFILGVEEWDKWCHCECQCKDGSIIYLPVTRVKA